MRIIDLHPSEYTMGLKGLTYLPVGIGVLFRLGGMFTTEGCLFPFDFLCLDENGTSLLYKTLKPNSGIQECPDGTKYVIEANTGELNNLDKIDIDRHIDKGLTLDMVRQSSRIREENMSVKAQQNIRDNDNNSISIEELVANAQELLKRKESSSVDKDEQTEKPDTKNDIKNDENVEKKLKEKDGKNIKKNKEGTDNDNIEDNNKKDKDTNSDVENNTGERVIETETVVSELMKSVHDVVYAVWRVELNEEVVKEVTQKIISMLNTTVSDDTLIRVKEIMGDELKTKEEMLKETKNK